MKVEVTCKACGKKLLRKPSQTHHKNIFCDKKCRADFERGQERVPRATCPVCEELFYLPPSQIKRARCGVNYCSYKCRAFAIQPPMVSRGKVGRRTDLDNQFFRSTWEANFARYLNYMISRGDVIKWEYEKERFDLKKAGFYLTDFRVFFPRHDVYFEIKGFFDKRARRKVRAFRRLFPQKQLVVVRKPEMRFIWQAFHQSLIGWEYGDKNRELREMRKA